MLSDEKLARLREVAAMAKALPHNHAAADLLANVCDPQTVLETVALFDVAVQQDAELTSLRARVADLDFERSAVQAEGTTLKSERDEARTERAQLAAVVERVREVAAALRAKAEKVARPYDDHGAGEAYGFEQAATALEAALTPSTEPSELAGLRATVERVREMARRGRMGGARTVAIMDLEAVLPHP